MSDFSQDVKVEGLAELERKLKQLPQRLQNRIMGGAMRAGGAVFRRAARSNVPSRTGALRRSIRVSARVRAGTVTGTVTAGRSGKKGDPFYAHMVEFGTKRSLIAPKNRKALKINGRFVRSPIIHPGTPARPFMRPAFDQGAQESIAAIASYIRDRLAKEGFA